MDEYKLNNKWQIITTADVCPFYKKLYCNLLGGKIYCKEEQCPIQHGGK